jgi:hypothetical protein
MVGIPWKVVKEHYGDKEPAPDDGMLGWVPKLKSKMENAERLNTDINVPRADLIFARLNNPKLDEALRDNVRMGDGEWTKNEAKELAHSGPVLYAAAYMRWVETRKGVSPNQQDTLQYIRGLLGVNVWTDDDLKMIEALAQASNPDEVHAFIIENGIFEKLDGAVGIPAQQLGKLFHHA